MILANSGWESALDNIEIRIDTRDQHAVLSPVTGTNRRALFTPDRVAIEAYVPGLRRTGLAQRGRCAADAGRALNAPLPGRLEPVGDIEQLATSKSAVSRRFVQCTEQKVAELFGRDLSQLDLLAIFIDGMLIAEHCVVVALGVDADGRKQPLGLWEGSTENKTVCNALLANLIERGLDPEQVRLFVLDGGKAIRAAVQSTFGQHAVIQRCRAHKRRNILEHLPQSERTFIGRKLDQAWKEPNAERAQAQLRTLAKHLEVKHPGAAASLLEGLEETLTVTRLGLSPSLLRTFKSTNPVESMISVGRTVAGKVKRWRNGKMALRWTAAGLLEAEKQFRRVNGYREMPILCQALQKHYRGLAPTRRIA